jgi:hypothetical protein
MQFRNNLKQKLLYLWIAKKKISGDICPQDSKCIYCLGKIKSIGIKYNVKFDKRFVNHESINLNDSEYDSLKRTTLEKDIELLNYIKIKKCTFF